MRDQNAPSTARGRLQLPSSCSLLSTPYSPSLRQRGFVANIGAISRHRGAASKEAYRGLQVQEPARVTRIDIPRHAERGEWTPFEGGAPTVVATVGAVARLAVLDLKGLSRGLHLEGVSRHVVLRTTAIELDGVEAEGVQGCDVADVVDDPLRALAARATVEVCEGRGGGGGR